MTQRTLRASVVLTVAASTLTSSALASPLPSQNGAAQDVTVEDEPVEEVDEWAELDKQLQALDSFEYTYEPSAEIWGYGRVNVFDQKATDATGVNLDNVRLNLTGSIEEYSYRITTDLAPGRLDLQDAWLSTAIGDEFAFTIGQFKIPFLRSGLVEARDLLFIARTRNGIFYSRRDQGAMINGDHGRFHWAIAGQNGADSVMDRMLTTANVRVNVIGEEELPWEGAYGAGNLTRLTFGAGISNDDAAAHGTAWALDGYLVHRRFSFQAEWLDYGEAYNLNPSDVGEQRGGTSPWSVTASYMIHPEKYEVAVRYDDFDDVPKPLNRDRRTLTFGINRYIQGHNIKWQLNYATAHKGGSSDGPHDGVVALGVTVSF